MRSKLSVEMQQKVDDEDDRIAKAVAEREKKRENEEAAKQQNELVAKRSIHEHRTNMVRFVCVIVGQMLYSTGQLSVVLIERCGLVINLNLCIILV